MTRGKQLLFILLACVSLFAFLGFQWQDPALHQDADAVTSQQAVARSSQFWQEQGMKVEGLDVVVTLDGVSHVDGFLNRHDLYEDFRQKEPKQAPLAFWKVTFYDEEGLNTYISKVGYQSGQVVGYQLSSSGEVQDVLEGKAREAAEKAFRQMGLDPTHLSLKTEKEDEKSGALIRQYHKENTDFHLEGLTQHHVIEVTGDQVTKLDYDYDVPAAFSEWRDWQKSIGALLTILSMLLSFALVVVALVFLFLLKQKKPYKSALWLSLLLFGLFLLSNLNEWPVMKQEVLAGGGGAISVLLVGAFAIFAVVIFSLLMAAGTIPVILTGGMLVREVKPRLWTSWHDPQWPTVLRKSVWYGYLLAFIWLGLQAVFYWVGENLFDVWYEEDYSMSPTNMWLPLLFPLLAWLAGIQEELTYRLLGVTLLKRYLNNSWVAVLIPAMIWALGHSLYPVYPIYTRFVELTIFGALIGFSYLWFGIETVIFAHVIFDTVLMCIPLLLSGDPLQIGSGVIFLLLPVVVGYGLGLFRPRPQQEIVDSV